MVTEVDVATALVLTVKVAVVPPAGTVTLDDTVATPGSVLESETSAPPLGASPLSVTVPVEELPPVTLAGLRLSEEGAGAGGVTESEAVWAPPVEDAEMVTRAEARGGGKGRR